MNRIGRLTGRAMVAAMAVALGALTLPGAALAATGTTTRVSVDSGGIQGNARSSQPCISGNGRFVAFLSDSTGMVAGDTNGVADVFVHDRVTGVTTRVSVDSSGGEGNGLSYQPSVSSDGRYVAFGSEASNLVADDTNAASDVFVHDNTTGVTTRVSVDSSGGQGLGASGRQAISADGRYVSFESLSSSLVSGDTNGTQDIFVHDRVTGVTTRASVDSSGAQGNADCFGVSISADGRRVAFGSDASNLVAGDTNGQSDVFVHDRATGATARASVSTSGTEGADGSHSPSISANGRFVAFSSVATNLAGVDTSSTNDIFVRDLVAGTTICASVDPSGVPGNGGSNYPSISSDGRFVAFDSLASNLVGDANAQGDVFVRDRITGTTSLASLSSMGVQGDSYCWLASISADGHWVAFRSDATNLVAGDTNAAADILLNEAPTLSTSITLKASASTARIGNTRTLRGTVTPLGMLARTVKLYVKKPGKGWTLLKTCTTTLSSGHVVWKFSYKFKRGMRKGLYKFKAVVPARPGFLTSTSAVKSIRLR